MVSRCVSVHILSQMTSVGRSGYDCRLLLFHCCRTRDPRERGAGDKAHDGRDGHGCDNTGKRRTHPGAVAAQSLLPGCRGSPLHTVGAQDVLQRLAPSEGMREKFNMTHDILTLSTRMHD